MIGLELNFYPIDPRQKFHPIKIIPKVPGYLIRLQAIDIRLKPHGGSFSISECIWQKNQQNLPYILTMAQGLHPASELFYFTINTQYENTFKYLGKSDEEDPEKKQFLQTFLEANNGSADAQYQLADMYAEGRGVKQNNRFAFRYYTLSALQGNLRAQVVLASCISRGLFVEQDPEAAVIVFKYLSDTSNYPEAQFRLALHLQDGLGCEKNTKEAIRYATLAAEQDHLHAKTLLTQLTNNQ